MGYDKGDQGRMQVGKEEVTILECKGIMDGDELGKGIPDLDMATLIGEEVGLADQVK